MKNDVLLGAFDRLVARIPSSPFAISTTHRSTLGEVDALARGVGASLAELELPSRSIVVLAALNGPGLAAGLIGALRSGYVPLLADGGIKDAEIERLAARLPVAAVLRCSTVWPRDERALSVSRWPATRSEREDLAEEIDVILLTSASSGLPRGVGCTSAQLVADHEALASAMGLLANDRLLGMIPWTHSYGLSTLLLPALVRGNTLVLVEGVGPFQALIAAQECEATFFPTVPAYLAALLQMSEPPPLPRSLRLVISAGARLPPATAAAWRERYGFGVHSLYGSTECGGITYDREGSAAERGTVGEKIGGVSVELETHAGAAEGAGRVVVASAAVATGYVPAEPAKLSAGRFVSDDLARWVGSELELVGRTNETIHVRGEKVDPREVESVIAEHVGVRDVHVLGLPQDGSAEPVVTAVVACDPGALTAAHVAAWCRARLAGVKVPRNIVMVDELPRGSRGKVDVAAIRARVAS